MTKQKDDLSKFVEAVELKQIEHSAELAGDFVIETILPLLENFEQNNDDPDYVSGMATHGLFVELVRRMGEMGYTEKDLRREIKTYINWAVDQTYH